MSDNQNSLIKKIISYEFLLTVLILVGLAGSLTTMELRAEEPRRAIVAMEMMLGDNWIVPKIHGHNYYNKPPLFNWALAATFTLAGSFDEVFVRLSGLLAYLLSAFLVFKVVTAYSNRKAGFISAILLVLAVDLFFYGAVDAGEIDLFLMLLVFIQAISFLHFSQKRQWWAAFIISYTMAAAGLLAKGLPVIVIHGLMIVCWLVYTKDFKRLFSLPHFMGILLCAALVVSYFFAYSQQADVSIYLTQLINETTNRAAPGNKLLNIAANILKSPLQLFYISFPASAILSYAFNKKVRGEARGNPLFMFSVVFALVSTVPFFASTSTANRYLYPAFPFLAIMAGVVFMNASDLIKGSKWLISYKTLLGVFIFLAVARIGYNIWGIPYQQNTSAKLIYRSKSAALLQMSKGNPIYLTGFPERSIANPTLPFINIKPQEVVTPPLIPYQFAYYITKQTNTVMTYHPVPLQELYYLAPVDFIKGKDVNVHHVFHDIWVNRDVALVTFE